jgi:hypothetical protein
MTALKVVAVAGISIVTSALTSFGQGSGLSRLVADGVRLHIAKRRSPPSSPPALGLYNGVFDTDKINDLTT